VDAPSRIKILYALLAAPLVVLFGPYEVLIKSIGILVIFDIISGIIVARKEGKAITSKRFWSRKGPTVALFLMGLAAAAVASPLLAEFGIEANQAGKWFCALYGTYELFSILENLGKLGLPVASKFSELMRSKLPEETKPEKE